MLDLQVKRRFALMRRSFATLGFSNPGMQGEGGRADLMLDDSGVTPRASERDHGVEWRRDHRDDALLGTGADRSDTRPSPDAIGEETREAIFRLAYAIRREAEVLDDLGPRARAEARRLLREEKDLADALETVGHEDLRAALDLLAPPIAALVGEIAATALCVSLAAVRAGAAARGFNAAASGIDVLARILENAWADAEALVVVLEERSADTAAVASSLRLRGAAIGRESGFGSRGLPDSDHDREAGSEAGSGEHVGEVADLRRLARETAEIAIRVSAAADDLARTVRTLSDSLVALGRQASGDRRRDTRVSVDAPCEMLVASGRLPGRVTDISPIGALVRLDTEAPLGAGQPVSFVLPDAPAIAGTVVEAAGRDLRVVYDLRHEANAAARPALERLLREADG